ncbi:DUF6252 family protein [Mucilaginibacter lacusdianchii]|uniref:DUF6252 family protein n=1 Tax=Mucilaginibacter lacusdianchii TaxID=2684211 RepID=UPI00131EB5CF|nr:DUF6252 family protein [Mucilaginibacter sp. JXJ CY 39]
MKRKITLLILFFTGAVLMQSCKKKDDDDSTTTTPTLQAYINGPEWTPDTLSASVVYNTTAKIKVLTITGTMAQKRATVVVTMGNASNDNTFSADTYRVDGSGSVVMTYYTQQKAADGSYVFVQHGTVQSGSGSVVVTSADATAKTLTGTFSFISTNKTYDSQGNIISVDVANILSGQFNGLPYTYTISN